MKKVLIFTLLFFLTVIIIGSLAIWKTVVQPNQTRLALYEIITASQKNLDNPKRAEEFSSWLDALKDMNTAHLEPCEHIQYHNQNASLKRRLRSLDVDRQLPPTSLQKAAQTYVFDPPSLQSLSEIADTEFERVMSEIQVFQTELRENGFAGTLQDLAAAPKNFTSDSKEVEQTYNHLIAKGEKDLASRFYVYDVPKGSAKVKPFAHRWGSYAQYNKAENNMTAFFDTELYDLKIAAFISIHEIYPGHHLDSKAGLLEPLCAGDNPAAYSWLSEGWATYAEFIANEEGFFQAPEHKLAWFDYRLTRAMRITLDVKRMQGLSERGALKLIWDQHMPERLAGHFDREFHRIRRSRHQHLSYVLGHKAIVEAKLKLKRELGSDFDEKKFHDAILRLEHKEPLALYDTLKVAMEMS